MTVARNALRGIACVATLALIGCITEVRVPAPPPVAAVPRPAATMDSAPPDAEVAEQANEAPPPLPVYEQPACPGDGYLWQPGYWAYAPAGYYWVPGTWVMPPRVGLLWTPGYWGFVGGVYVFHAGYWGPHVGFYGGINYGFGYGGVGFSGGRWAGRGFVYNRAVTNLNVTVVHNTYNETVVNNVVVNRVSYNGGAGVAARPTVQERLAAREPHVLPTPQQLQHVQQAARNPALFAHANGGHPAVTATARPGAIPSAAMHPMPQPGLHSEPARNVAAPGSHATQAWAYQAKLPTQARAGVKTTSRPPANVAKAKGPKAGKRPPERPGER